MAEYYVEVTTRYGTYNRNDDGSIEQIRKLAVKRIIEKKGYGAYIHQKIAGNWVLVGRIDCTDDYKEFHYLRYLYPNGYDKRSNGSTSYKLYKDGHISKGLWTYKG